MNYSLLLKMYSPDEIAKYIRLSLEDRRKGVKDESESISNQRIIINQFIDQRGNKGSQCREFVDDGKSGTNFDRPGWQELLEEIEAGKIKVVITKNLSRLGRSNFECGYYMDYYFPSVGVRFMTVQEDVDTEQNKASNEYAPLNNFMNEKYSRDLSRNVKNSKRVKQEAGEYIGGGKNAPYGYKVDPEDKHHLIVEEYSAKIVRQIFDWYIETESQLAVRKKLYENNILTPAAYKNLIKIVKRLKCPYQWDQRTIHDILTNEVYIGSMVQHRYEKRSFRSKKLSRVPKDEWIIVPDKHEAIINNDTFEKVQNLIKANHHSSTENSEKELLHGILFCHECQHRLNLSRNDRVGKDGTVYRHIYTHCTYHRKNRNLHVCSLHSNNYFNVEESVLQQLDNICDKYIKVIEYEKLTEEKKKNIKTYGTILKEKISSCEVEVRELDAKIEKLYMDRLDNVISIDTYQKISSKLEQQKENLQSVVSELTNSLITYEDNHSMDKILETNQIVKEYQKSRKKLDRNLILKLVDRIEIHEDRTIDLFLKLKPLQDVQ